MDEKDRFQQLREIYQREKSKIFIVIGLLALVIVLDPIYGPKLLRIVQAQDGSPDLIVRHVEAQQKMTGGLRISGEIFNQGDAVAPPTKAGATWNGKTLTPTISTRELSPGEGAEFSDDFQSEGDLIIVDPQAGGFVKVTADSTDLVSERNEENNSKTTEVKLPLPDRQEIFRLYLPVVIN